MCVLSQKKKVSSFRSACGAPLWSMHRPGSPLRSRSRAAALNLHADGEARARGPQSLEASIAKNVLMVLVGVSMGSLMWYAHYNYQKRTMMVAGPQAGEAPPRKKPVRRSVPTSPPPIPGLEGRLTSSVYSARDGLLSFFKAKELLVDAEDDDQFKFTPDRKSYCPRDEAKQQAAGSGKGTYKYVAIGLARTWDEIELPAVETLAELNCKYNIPLDVIVAEVPADISEVHLCNHTHAGCAPIKLYTEPEEVRKRIGPYKNRVARIARVRDSQREALAEEYKDEDVKAFIALDLDLMKLPKTEEMLRAARDMNDGIHSYDGVCALGLETNQVGDDYYDTFATVFHDGTFSYPKKMRKFVRRSPVGEDEGKIVSQSAFGAFTQWDVTQYLRHQASLQLNRGLAPVLSCFGGAAVYKAAPFLATECEYEWQPDPKSIDRADTMWLYTDSFMERACEHIVLHFCMHKHFGSKFAIDPRMDTWWKSDPAPPKRSMLMNEGSWHAEAKNVLGTFRTYYDGAWLDSKTPLELTNGHYRAFISDLAQLVIENTETGAVLWSVQGPLLARFQNNWSRLLLVLGPYGELLLLQQVREAYPENAHLCRPFDDAPAPRCRLLLWRLNGVGAGDYALMLSKAGTLEAKSRYFDEGEQVVKTYWSSAWDPADPEGPYQDYLYYSECYQLQCDLLTNRDWNRANELQGRWNASDHLRSG